MLLLSDCKLFGLEKGEELSFVVRETGYPLVSVVGRPSEDAIREAVAGAAGYEIFVPPENGTHVAAALPGWDDRLRRCTCSVTIPGSPASSRARCGRSSLRS
jgi:hypothetical protein